MDPRHLHALEQLRALLVDLSETTAKAAALYYHTLIAEGVPEHVAKEMAIARSKEIDERILGRLLP